MSLFSVLSGIVSALVFLYLFDRFGGDIMSEVFVDRKIPVNITLKGLLISFSVPYLISLLFGHFSLRQFRKENDYLSHVRSIGS